jgi:hypothetical protein
MIGIVGATFGKAGRGRYSDVLVALVVHCEQGGPLMYFPLSKLRCR